MSAPPLPGVLQSLVPLLNSYGYLAVGGLITLEDFGIPAPGETVLIAAAAYAGAGQLSVVGVGIVGLLAAIVGDNIGYAIGRFGGRALVLRYGRYVFITGERLATAEQFFTRHGGKIVTVARFIEGLRQANGIIAGISGMHWLKFLAFNALGAALWVGAWTSVGYFAGQHIGTIYSYANRYSLYLLAAVAVLIVALIARRMLRRRHRAGAPERDLAGAPDRHSPDAPDRYHLDTPNHNHPDTPNHNHPDTPDDDHLDTPDDDRADAPDRHHPDTPDRDLS